MGTRCHFNMSNDYPSMCSSILTPSLYPDLNLDWIIRRIKLSRRKPHLCSPNIKNTNRIPLKRIPQNIKHAIITAIKEPYRANHFTLFTSFLKDHIEKINTKIRPANYDAEFGRSGVAIYAISWESILIYILPSSGRIVRSTDGEECWGGESDLCSAGVDDPLDIWPAYTREAFSIERKPVDVDGVEC
jgi:hypothetical protein